MLLLTLINLPYAVAYLAGPQVFGGVLFALADGQSYLAKMREGWRGEWLFTLPYTAEPGEGVFLFTYYLFLGHVARWLGLSLETVYHTARLMGGLGFLLSAYHFLGHFMETPRARLGAWLFFSLSSGWGWAAALTGAFTMDLWVAESIPFLTLFSNAHFPLAWALMLWLVTWSWPGLSAAPLGRRLGGVALAAAALAIAQPMGLIPIGAALGAGLVLEAARTRRLDLRLWAPALVLGLSAAPWLINALWAAQTHPVLQGWNAQNLTPSPGLGEALLWGGLPLALAAAGAWRLWRERAARPRDMLALIWVLTGVGLMYAPLALQRRLSIGLWLPLCVLAVQAVRGWLSADGPRWRRLAVVGALALLPLSNLLVWAGGLAAATTRDPALFLTSGEAAALAHLPAGQVVLAAPDTGGFIPARSDARVLYGHPFETVPAAAEKQLVETALMDRAVLLATLDARGVDVVVWGPREAAYGPAPELPAEWRRLFEAEGVTVWGR